MATNWRMAFSASAAGKSGSTGGSFFGALPGDEVGVSALNFGGILQHDRGKVARGEGGMNVSGEALAAEVRKIAAVVNVRVTEHGGVNLAGVEGELPVALDGFLAPALEQAAFQQEPLVVHLDEVWSRWWCGWRRGNGFA